VEDEDVSRTHGAKRIPAHPALLSHHKERSLSLQNRIADAITGWAGSMSFVYIHVVWFLTWVVAQPFHDVFPFGLLTMIVSLEAIFLATFVMISQNRADEKRQLLADHQWKLIQIEEKQNEQLLHIVSRLLELTTEVHALTREVHHAVKQPAS
jgi:uncharacterized membrane protein